MKNKPILIVAGETYSIFFEIFFKSIKKYKYKSPIILICSKKILLSQIKKYNFNKKIRLINQKNLDKIKVDNKAINIINVEFQNSNIKELKLEFKANHIKKCFDIAFGLIRNKYTNKLINGPINKKTFLNKKFLGVTEYIASKFKIKKVGMLIYNKKLSVSPLTTHLPLKFVSKKITKKLIREKITIIDNFYKKQFGFTPKIAVTGLNPHCESIAKFNEDEKIIASAIKLLTQKKFNIKGPFPADTIFLKNNRNKFDIILGMYHDQVLTPIKTLFEYDAINITMGLPFLRITPDHGPNERMFGQNKSNPLSLVQALKFLDKR